MSETCSVGTVTELVEGRLFALSHPYEIGRRVSTHPLDARGYAPMQCYLLKEDDGALLVGTGLTIHQDHLLAQLEALVGPARLSLAPLRIELNALCNARPIADRFEIEAIYQRVPFPASWLDFRPEFAAHGGGGLQRAEIRMIGSSQPFAVDPARSRPLVFLVPPLRLIANPWLYDEVTRTLFTADMFGWTWLPDDRGPWVITEQDDDSTTLEDLQHFLFQNRYWWLPGAQTATIRSELADIFERHQVETIAPDYGRVLHGAKVVSRHYQLLDDVLAAAPSEPAICVSAGKLTFAMQQ